VVVPRGIDLDEMQIGTPVEVYFHRADEGVAVPFWSLRARAQENAS